MENQIEMNETRDQYRIVNYNGRPLTAWQYGTLKQARARFGNKQEYTPSR